MTGAWILRKLFTAGISAVALLAVPLAGPAAAQERPLPALEFAAGWVGFADDGIVDEGLVGGAARFYLLPRISVGPEIAYIQGGNHSHLMVIGNVTCDLLRPVKGLARRVNPFVVVGGGLFQTRQRFFNESFRSSEGAFTAGGGVRAVVGDRVTVGADARIGWELHIRLSGTVGVRLGQ